MKQPYWLYVIWNLTLVPAWRLLIRGVHARLPIAAAFVALLFMPFVGMLYLGRWKRSILYLITTIVALFYGRLMLQLNPELPDFGFSLLEMVVRVIGAVDAYYIAKRQDKPKIWYSKWYSILALWLFVIGTMYFGLYSVRLLLVDAFSNHTNSMAPTIKKDDYFLVKKIPTALENGDIIMHRYPGKPQISYVRRIIGKSGDKVKMLGGHIYINNEPVIRMDGIKRVYRERMPNGVTYDTLDLDKDYTSYDHFPARHVPAGHYFVMGDNRDRSHDSRSMDEIGFISENDVIGKVIYICKAPCKLLSWQ